MSRYCEPEGDSVNRQEALKSLADADQHSAAARDHVRDLTQLLFQELEKLEVLRERLLGEDGSVLLSNAERRTALLAVGVATALRMSVNAVAITADAEESLSRLTR